MDTEKNEIVFFFRVTVTPRRLVHSTQLHSLVNVQHVGCGCSGSPHFLDGRVLRNVCPPLEGPSRQLAASPAHKFQDGDACTVTTQNDVLAHCKRHVQQIAYFVVASNE